MDELLQAHTLAERGNVAANPHYDHPPVQAPSLQSELEADERPTLDPALQDRFERLGRLFQRDLPRNRFL